MKRKLTASNGVTALMNPWTPERHEAAKKYSAEHVRGCYSRINFCTVCGYQATDCDCPVTGLNRPPMKRGDCNCGAQFLPGALHQIERLTRERDEALARVAAFEAEGREEFRKVAEMSSPDEPDSWEEDNSYPVNHIEDARRMWRTGYRVRNARIESRRVIETEWKVVE